MLSLCINPFLPLFLSFISFFFSFRSRRSLVRKEHNSKLTVTYPSTVYRKSGKKGTVDEPAGKIFAILTVAVVSSSWVFHMNLGPTGNT